MRWAIDRLGQPWKTTIIVLGAAALLLLIIPAAVLFAFTSRLLFVIALISLPLLFASQRFRRWTERKASDHWPAASVMFYPQHSWACRQWTHGGVVVGADDLVQKTLGPIDEVQLPAPGTRYRQGEPLFSLRRADRAIEVRAPVSGRVMQVNEDLRRNPRQINRTPYGDGWVAKIMPDALGREGSLLCRGRRAKAWLEAETERMVATALPSAVPCRVLQDGGALVDDLHVHIDDQAWPTVVEAFFGGHS